MAKRYSEGEFLRKIRRGLMSDGLQREVGIVPRPAYRASTSPTLVEIVTTLADGTRLIHHHNAANPGTPACVERICAQQRERAGLPLEQIEAMLAGVGPALATGEGMHPMVVHHASDMPLMVMACANLHDIAGRRHERTLSLPAGDVAPWWRKHDDLQKLELDLDRARRRPNGTPRALRIDGGLAEFLRTESDGAWRLKRIVAALHNGIDKGGQADGHTPITIDSLSMAVDGLLVSAGARGIRIKMLLLGEATLTGSVLTVPGRLPETVMLAIAGRKLAEIVTPAPLRGDIEIVRAQARQAGTALTLRLAPIGLADLQNELGAH